jgi:hypothetical protein
MRRGPANGSTHVANIKNRKSHPDNANQRKKIVYKKKTRKLSEATKKLHNQHPEYIQRDNKEYILKYYFPWI